MADERNETPEAAAILRARAHALARRSVEQAPIESLELLEFRLAREDLAIEARHVREVLALRELTPVPGTPAFVVGIVNVRGRIAAVIDVQKFFGLPVRGVHDLHHVILLEHDRFELGLLADRVQGVQAVPAASVHALAPGALAIPDEFVRGITDRGSVLLDLDRLLRDPTLLVQQEIEP